MCMEDIKAWIKAFIHPADFIKKKKTSWGEGFAQVIESGFAGGIILGFFIMILIGLGSNIPAPMLPAPLAPLRNAIMVSTWSIGFAVWMLTIIAMTVYSVFTWFIGTIPLYASTRLFGGKADFEVHANNLAWLFAPLNFIASIVAWIPIAGPILVTILGIYALYPLTIIIRETHRIETWEAICAWLFWIVITALAVITGGMAIMSLVSSMGSFLLMNPNVIPITM